MEKIKLRSILKNLFKYNFRVLFLFELFYKLFAYGIFMPFLVWLFQKSLDFSKLKYLTTDNIGKWLKTPATWGIFILLLILFACYVLVDMTVVILCVDCSIHKEYISGTTLIWESVKSVTRIFHPRNLLLVVLLLLEVPVVGLSFVTGYITSIQLPEFFTVMLEKMLRNYRFLPVGILILLIAAFYLIFSIHYYVLEKKNFGEAVGKGHYLVYKVYFRNFIKLLFWQVFMYLAYWVLMAILIFLIIAVAFLFRHFTHIYAVMLSVIEWMINAITLLFSCVAIPFSMIFVSYLFYHNKYEIGEEETKAQYRSKEVKIKRWKRNLIMLLAGAGLIVLNVSNLKDMQRGVLGENNDFIQVTQITAHRGYSSEYPENSLAAFEGAIDVGVDWVELDVQQTRDGVLVVMHDPNLKRISRADINIWEITYEELMQYDSGSFFDREYEGLTYCTLEEALELCKDRVRVNIELKPTGHEQNFESAVAELVEELEMESECVIASMSYATLTKIKECNPDLETVYVIKSVYGNFANLPYADNFSIRYSYLSKKVVDAIHARGKRVYAWTLNSDEKLKNMIQIGVDNLITDYPVKARKAVFEHENSSIITKYINMLTEWVR